MQNILFRGVNMKISKKDLCLKSILFLSVLVLTFAFGLMIMLNLSFKNNNKVINALTAQGNDHHHSATLKANTYDDSIHYAWSGDIEHPTEIVSGYNGMPVNQRIQHPITSLTITNDSSKIPANAVQQFDVTETTNYDDGGTLTCYVFENNDSGHDCVIYGNVDVIYAPENSQYLFSGYMGQHADLFTCFSGSLKNVNFDCFDTSKVVNMEYMFMDDWYAGMLIESLDLSGFDTSNVTNMNDMFYTCSSLATLDISNFNISNVTDSYEIFGSCSSLTKIYIPNGAYDTFSVADGFSDKASAMEEIPVVTVGDYEITTTSVYGKKGIKIVAYNGSASNLTIPDQLTYTYPAGYPFTRTQTLDVTYLGDSAFEDNEDIVNLTIGDTVLVIGDSAFNYNTNLNVVSIGLNVRKIDICAFSDTFNLTRIVYSAKNCSDITLGDNLFNNSGVDSSGVFVVFGNDVEYIPRYLFDTDNDSDPKIVSIKFGNSITSIGTNRFEDMPYLTSIDFGAGLESIEAGAFADCPNITSIKLRSAGVTLGNNALFYSSSTGNLSFDDCEIILPPNTLNSYKSATNWSRFASIMTETTFPNTGVGVDIVLPSVIILTLTIAIVLVAFGGKKRKIIVK